MTTSDIDDRTNLTYWFPKVQDAGIRVPGTRIIETTCDLWDLLDGETPDGWRELEEEVQAASDEMGYPCFLRTGHTSAKHSWRKTCFLERREDVGQHILNLVDQSGMSDLPMDTWVVRRMIPTTPLFYAFHGKMPITREFRLFVRDELVEHIQPYWPAEAIQNAGSVDWMAKLTAASRLTTRERIYLTLCAQDANAVCPGYWSVDFLQDRDGKWWLTDMAAGERSYMWQPPTDLMRAAS
jgi:hypothetical protein